MGKGLRVSTDELQHAAATLQSVGNELNQGGDLGAGSKDLGSQELSIAVNDFCQKAGTVAVALRNAVHGAGITAQQSATAYETTELTAARSFKGHF